MNNPMRRKHQTNFYELALLLADGQARKNKHYWPDFIDNLSRICDNFASHKTGTIPNAQVGYKPR